MDMPYTRFLDDSPAGEDRADGIQHDIPTLLSGFSVEVTGNEALKVGNFSALIPPGTLVFMPFLPNSTLAACIPTAERLAREGMVPVPHIAARQLTRSAELADVLDRLHETAGLSSALVIAGDRDTAAGPYADSMELLETGILERHGISNIGIAGYPDRHPVIPERLVWDSLARKCEYAKASKAEFRIVSQFTFSHQSVLRWDQKLKQAGVALPIHISVPGPAKLTTLFAYARRCGVFASLRQVTRNRAAVMGLVAAGTPDRLLTGIARYRARPPDSLIAGIHFNTFGGFEETARWVKSVMDCRFVMNRGNDGFAVKQR